MPTGTRIRTDSVFGTLTDNPLLVGATTMNSAGLAGLAAVSGNHAVIVIDPLKAGGAPEIVIVTAHTAAATSATITRGAYGTTARQHASGTLWIHAPTTEDLIRIVTSGTRPSDPYRGQLIFETDTNSYVGRDTSDAWQTAVPLGAWTSYTPTLTQSATVTKTTTYAKYIRVGRMITVVVDLAVTGAGTAANVVLIGLPVTASASGLTIGSGLLYDVSSGGTYRATCEISTTTTVLLRGTTSTALDALGTAVFTAALAAGDIVRYCATYEAAA